MSRNNRLIDLVFSNIIRKKDNVNAAEKFLASDRFLGLPESPALVKYKKMYADINARISEELNLLADLEEIIIQLRCHTYVPKDFKLSITGNFIYVKVLFYRQDKITKDIRIIAGRVDEFLNSAKDLETLYDNQEFIEFVGLKLKTTMQKEIDQTITKLTQKTISSGIYMEI